MSSSFTRRRFLESSAGTVLGMAAASAIQASPDDRPDSPARPASEKVNYGLIGCGGISQANLGAALTLPDVNLVAVCDIDQSRLDSAVDRYGGPGKVKAYTDYRKLLEQKDIDVACICTPDHWHVIPALHAIQAGKDVYVEKPLGHNIREGRVLLDAARKHKRVVSGGTQQRTDPHFQRAVQYVQSGALGRITFCQAWNTQWDNGIGNPPDSPVPPGVNYDMWLGPAPNRPFNKNRFHYNFRWFQDYAGGMMCDWGVHLLDIIIWGMQSGAPRSMAAFGGKYDIPDDRDWFDTIQAVYNMEGGGKNAYPFVMQYAMRKRDPKMMDGKGYGIEFHGTNGTLFVDRSGFEVTPHDKAIAPLKVRGHDDKTPHHRNFVDCVKGPRDSNGMRPLPASDVENVHISTLTCHLANISILVGRSLTWDAEKEECVGDREASQHLTRHYRKGYELPKV